MIGYASGLSAKRGEAGEDERQDTLEWREKLGDWIAEGEKRVDSVARRYGLFGYEKGVKVEGGGATYSVMDKVEEGQLDRVRSNRAAADIANAMAAYVVVKVR